MRVPLRASKGSKSAGSGVDPTEKVEVVDETAELWEEFGGTLKRFIARRVRNEHDAEDLLQEVFLRAHVAFYKVEDKGRARPWLYRIAANVIADHYRSKRVAIPPVVPHERAEDAADLENLNREVLPCLVSAIGELPDGYRSALTLADLEGRTQKEVAEELGLSLSGTKSRIQRARSKLKAALLSCCYFELDRLGNVLGYRPKNGTCRYYSC
jgi:RNA polymerase sigma-70 factor, ECF subfamily